MTDKATSDPWWKSAVIYCVDVELFADRRYDSTAQLGLNGGERDGGPLDINRRR